MTSRPDLEADLTAIFETTLNVAVPSVDTDLLEQGQLNSVTFVELMVALEERYGVVVPLDDLEIESFRSIRQIALFVAGLMEAQRVAA